MSWAAIGPCPCPREINLNRPFSAVIPFSLNTTILLGNCQSGAWRNTLRVSSDMTLDLPLNSAQTRSAWLNSNPQKIHMLGNNSANQRKIYLESRVEVERRGLKEVLSKFEIHVILHCDHSLRFAQRFNQHHLRKFTQVLIFVPGRRQRLNMNNFK